MGMLFCPKFINTPLAPAAKSLHPELFQDCKDTYLWCHQRTNNNRKQRYRSTGFAFFKWTVVVGCFNSLRPRQNGRLFADVTFKRIFLNENIRISTKISLKFVSRGLINNIPALVLIMAWRRPGDKPLSEPMLVRSLTHICVTRPQWIKQDME